MKNILKEIEISSEYIGNAAWRPYSSHRADKWEVWLYRGENKIRVEFYRGEGHNGRDPQLKEVIYALLNDSQAGELSFEDFCSDFGYDTDSRRAYAIWDACRATRVKLGQLFSPEEIEGLEAELADY